MKIKNVIGSENKIVTLSDIIEISNKLAEYTLNNTIREMKKEELMVLVKKITEQHLKENN